MSVRTEESAVTGGPSMMVKMDHCVFIWRKEMERGLPQQYVLGDTCARVGLRKLAYRSHRPSWANINICHRQMFTRWKHILISGQADS